jgi:hypothetical protein
MPLKFTMPDLRTFDVQAEIDRFLDENDPQREWVKAATYLPHDAPRPDRDDVAIVHVSIGGQKLEVVVEPATKLAATLAEIALRVL